MRHPPTPCRAAAVLSILVLLGAVFRFGNLDAKPYWFNEVFTALQMAGYDEHVEVNPRLYDRGEITSADFQHFQRLNPEKSAGDTIRGLARKEPHSPPLYFLLARVATRWLGDTVVATRGLSAFCSLLALFALYWLGMELFEDQAAALTTVGLMAVSPFFVHYAQEARPYGMWLLTLLLASATLLRAIRVNTWWSWALYAGMLVLALYTHLLTALVLMVHGLYVLALSFSRREAIVVRFFVAALAAGFAFLPWIAVLVRGARMSMAIGGYLGRPTSADFLVESWCLSLDRLFVAWPAREGVALVLWTIPILILVGVSLFLVCRFYPPRVGAFVILLVGVPLLTVLVPDLVLGGQRSLQARYLLPTFLGLQLAVAGTLAANSGRADGLRAWAWRGVTAVVLLAGGLSSLAAVRADTWWGLSEVDLDLVKVFNGSPSPRIVSDAPFGVIAPLSYRLHADVRFLLTKQPETLVLPKGSHPVYVYQPSDRLCERIERDLGMTLLLVYQKPREDRTVYCLYELTVPEGR